LASFEKQRTNLKKSSPKQSLQFLDNNCVYEHFIFLKITEAGISKVQKGGKQVRFTSEPTSTKGHLFSHATGSGAVQNACLNCVC